MSVITPPRGYNRESVQRRREWLAEKKDFYFDNDLPQNPENYRGIIENLVAEVNLPIAIAGPLLISGSYSSGEFYVPLCTLEGTLAMSMTRGLFLTSLSGGIQTQHVKQELSRSPIFIFNDIHTPQLFLKWVEQNFAKIKVIAESTTNYGKLLRIDKYPIQNRIILDFVYNTAEAAGQNMVTIATEKAVHFIFGELRDNLLKDAGYCIECNFNGDKNSTYRSMLHGRGHSVIASFRVPDKLLRRILRLGVREFVDRTVEMRLGSELAGVLGLNMHAANALAAIYLATGQDVACVAENAVGIVTYESLENDEFLYGTLSMPSITVGTVGGGTRLPQQAKNLQLLECQGENSSKKFAEIVCAATLALEVSLAGAIGSHEFARSHATYGRR